jgi:Arc/MetJ-type ribon-helix-helix transcriptional regulator
MRAVNNKSVIVPLRMTGAMAAKLDKAVTALRYRSRNEFIREAIEEHVEAALRSKVVEVRDMSVEQALLMIDAYLSKRPGTHYVSEIAEELGLELSTAFEAAQALLKGGSARVRP